MVLAWSKFLGVSHDFELNRSVRGSVRTFVTDGQLKSGQKDIFRP